MLLLVFLNPLGCLDAIAGLPMASRAVSRASVRPPSVAVEVLFKPLAQVIPTEEATKLIAFRRKKARIKRAWFGAAKRSKRNVVIHVVEAAGGF